MSGPKDSASATDHVEAGVTQDVVAPNYPCPTCSKETKDANGREELTAGKHYRVCSSASCNAKSDWTSGSAVLMNN